MQRKPNSKEERQLRSLLDSLGFTETQANILVRIAGKPRTALEVHELTQTPRSHIHSFLKRQGQAVMRIVQETKERPKRYYLYAEGLGAAIEAKARETRNKLTELEKLDARSLLESMRALEERVKTVPVMPMRLSSTEEVHDKAAFILKQSKDVLIGTNWPFPWLKEYQIDENPPKSIENYWDAHRRFLEKTKEEPDKFHLSYMVNLDVFVKLLNEKELSRVSGSIEAIINCIKMVKEGYSLDFIPRPTKGERPTLTTFISGRDTGLFVLSISHNEEVVLEGLYLQHPALAQAYGALMDMYRETAERYAERSEDRLKKILETILTRVKLPRITKKKYEQQLSRITS